MHRQWSVLNLVTTYRTRSFVVQTRGILFGKFSSPLIKAICPRKCNTQIRLDNDKQFGLCAENHQLLTTGSIVACLLHELIFIIAFPFY